MDVSGQLHAPAALSPSKELLTTIWRLSGPPSRSERDGEDKKSHYCPCRELDTGSPARILIPTLTELP